MEQEEYKQYLYSYIKLFSLYLNKKSAEDFIIDDKMLSFFIKLSKYHSLTAFLYKAIKDTKAKVNEEQLKKLEEWYYSNLRKTVLFDQERQKLYDFLNENQIDFLPLKGLVLEKYYSDPYTREFADNDILFASKAEAIKGFFVNRGYKVEMFGKWCHDTYMKNPFYNFEMHRLLFDESTTRSDIFTYFENYMVKSLVKDKFEHFLSLEDFYIYYTAHSYKHFHASGCGLRTLVDYYIFLKKCNLDFDYINKELESINLLEFSKTIKDLSMKLFDDIPLDDEEERTLLYISSSGTYGLLENKVENGIKERGKFGYFMRRVFPPLITYKNYYPWAYKTKVLIPVAWAFRLIRRVIKSPKKVALELKAIKNAKANKEK